MKAAKTKQLPVVSRPKHLTSPAGIEALEAQLDAVVAAQDQAEAQEAASASAETLRDLGFWAACQSETLIELLLDEPDLPNEDLLKSVLVRLQQLTGVTSSALEPTDVVPSLDALEDLRRVVYGNARRSA